MSNGIRTAIASIIFALLLVAPATSQEPATDPLAYTPTGDALWDTYAQALLEHLEKAPYGDATWGLPGALLDSWEGDFGNDPRFWQLRYWNEVQRDGFGGTGNALAIEYLEYGAELGVSDAVTEMLLYKYRGASLQRFWDYYPSKTPEQKAEFGMPDIPSGHASRQWFMEQEALLRDNLVAACPDESWAWYASAMQRFDYGDWEAGLDDLRRGNQAPNNRVPLPFPASFVLSRVVNEQECGNEIAAGIVARGLMRWPLTNFIRLKDHVKNQEVRLAMGAPLSELEPWHLYTCRMGSMDGASAINWLVALVLRNIPIKYLLVTTPEAFTIDQRDALWGLYGRSRKIRELVQYKISSEQPDSESIREEIRAVLLKHGVTMGPAEFMMRGAGVELPELGLSPETEAALHYDLKLVEYRIHYLATVVEYGTIYRQAKERFNHLATFDFATLSWPDKQ